ncbi:MAG TPA: glucose-6-phosphate dehydrogenase [Candidatus Dormibacteraeota bacterium]|jgi:glucose-6-phosphate 1-dehydrogenase
MEGVGTDLVIFGASGDLASRKILPAVARLAERGLLPSRLRVIGAGRSEQPEHIWAPLQTSSRGSSIETRWVRLAYGEPDSYRELRETLAGSATVIYYLATPPSTFIPIVTSLAATGLANSEGGRSRRIVVEKPLGSDLASAREIDHRLREAFGEEQVFRIDHYLAKDTVQNTLAFRFSNAVFEAMWNRTLIESIQVNVAEEVTIGSRAGYYDQVGAVRDMVQNHVLQLLALILMEPPRTLDAANIRRAKLDVLLAINPIDPSTAVRGQYEGYLDEPGVALDSRRETYAAARLTVDNWRWYGVPIYFRTGKALPRRVTQAIIRFRDAPLLRLDSQPQRGIPTLLVIHVQPKEGVTLRIGAKRPGARFEMVAAGMDLEYSRLTREELPEAYEHVLSEVLAGGHTVFPSGEEIERSWEIVDPLIRSWESGGHPETYRKGSWGPEEARELMIRTQGGRWINPGDEPGIS